MHPKAAHSSQSVSKQAAAGNKVEKKGKASTRDEPRKEKAGGGGKGGDHGKHMEQTKKKAASKASNAANATAVVAAATAYAALTADRQKSVDNLKSKRKPKPLHSLA